MQIDLFESNQSNQNEGNTALAMPDAKVFYLPIAFSQAQSDQYYHQLYELNWQQVSIEVYGKSVLTPRLQSFYGDEGLSYTYSNTLFKALPWQAPLLNIKRQVEKLSRDILGYEPIYNAVLGNLYRNGQDNMGWHADDETELGKECVIASLSFGATRDFKFKHKSTGEQLNLALTHGSLLLMAGTTQTFWYHALPKRMKVNSPRFNLTFRQIINAR
ncbi:alpha-ketoglutarate-dependent dioxygenase AlkB [Catenovulum sp. SM1970]|uniref:alpha-ketoglutarate-dependent dioxygenase AlkB family protein n=1 Tax=Marinifaba aquimaris TaxID=2741323 RepID=UPI001574A9F7|nr:alpha-ketoglutarate-dependent dioxygenase AlkB [Marinifaba aquimaris]NTS77596.1 alpha-ketoglutarate-dependent dioxygenase AlkB [Marinifaba aquimaris]